MTITTREQWLYDFTADLPCRLIKRGGQPYLERYYLDDESQQGLKKVFGEPPLNINSNNEVYLHRFVGSGSDADLHDHPWFSMSRILTGGYKERVVEDNNPRSIKIIERRALDCYFLSPHYIHQIVDPLPETWTLFSTAERLKSWSFFIEQTWENKPALMMVNWRDYLTKQGETQAQQLRHDWWDDPECPTGQTAGRERFQGSA